MMKEEEKLYTKELYDLSHTAAAPLLEGTTYPWEALPQIGAFIRELGAGLSLEEYDHPQEDVWIHKTAKIYPNNFIAGPCVIGAGTEVRPGAFIRGNALVGENCVVGNSTELKNVILFDNVQVPHYNYVGDSILGYKSHMGAGGAMLGDHVEVGCNSVLNPGTVVGRGSHVYPLSMMRGFLPSGMIHKNSGETVPLQERR